MTAAWFILGLLVPATYLWAGITAAKYIIDCEVKQ